MRKPNGLGEDASEFWDEVTGKYGLRPDELRVLRDVCKMMDTIERLEDEASTADLYLEGSMGQQVLNGVFGELRQHKLSLGRLMAQLKLPDSGGATGRASAAGSRSEAGRNLVAMRWNK